MTLVSLASGERNEAVKTAHQRESALTTMLDNLMAEIAEQRQKYADLKTENELLAKEVERLSTKNDVKIATAKDFSQEISVHQHDAIQQGSAAIKCPKVNMLQGYEMAKKAKGVDCGEWVEFASGVEKKECPSIQCDLKPKPRTSKPVRPGYEGGKASYDCCGLKSGAEERSIWDIKMPVDPSLGCRSGTETLKGYLKDPCITKCDEVTETRQDDICKLATR